LPLQGKKLALQVGDERGGGWLLALAFDGVAGGHVERLIIGDAGEQSVMSSRHR